MAVQCPTWQAQKKSRRISMVSRTNSPDPRRRNQYHFHPSGAPSPVDEKSPCEAPHDRPWSIARFGAIQRSGMAQKHHGSHQMHITCLTCGEALTLARISWYSLQPLRGVVHTSMGLLVPLGSPHWFRANPNSLQYFVEFSIVTSAQLRGPKGEEGS